MEQALSNGALCCLYRLTTETAPWTLTHNLATIHLQKQKESLKTEAQRNEDMCILSGIEP